MKTKKWVPLSENPMVKRSMKMRENMAKQNQKRMEMLKKNSMMKKKPAAPAKKAKSNMMQPKKMHDGKAMEKKPTFLDRLMKKNPPAAKPKVSSLVRQNKAVEVAKKKPAQDRNASPIPAEIVAFSGRYPKGTIVIDHSDRRLYHVLGGGKAKAYAVGVGKEGFEWTGTNRVTRKAEWPGWTPPARMIAREKKKGRILPAHMEGGPNNPLGARAMYLGSSYYRIHGTNQPWSLGKAVSSGCIRMANNDVSELYEHVKVGTKVIVRP